MRRTIAWLCSAAPFVAGAIAALGPRHDLRILCMAAVATPLAWVIVRAISPKQGVAVAAIMAFVSGAAGGAGVAVFSGARAAFGVIAVAVVVAAFATAGAALIAGGPKRFSS